MFRPEALAPTSLPTSWGLFATGGAAGGVTFLCLAHRVLEVLTALQPQIMAPSSRMRINQPIKASAKIVKDNHFKTGIDQCEDRVASDISGPSGY
jgi:hypothetical protein